jgi:hypothetical protein
MNTAGSPATSRRSQSRQRLQASALAAVAADAWIAGPRRREALRDMLMDPALDPFADHMLRIPRIVRRLPNCIAPLLDGLRGNPQLAPWLKSRDDLFRLCRLTGAVLYGSSLARFVDGRQVARLIDDLDADVWRFGIDHQLEPADGTEHSPVKDRQTLTDTLMSAGLRAVHAHLSHTLPDLVDTIGEALGLDWSAVGPGGDPAAGPEREAESLRRVLARVRTP